jgi:hypothetical protein
VLRARVSFNPIYTAPRASREPKVTALRIT